MSRVRHRRPLEMMRGARRLLLEHAFLEDVSVFTAQQRNIELDPDAPTIDINADSGGIQARRIVDRLYQEEQATMAAAKTAAE